MFLRSELHEFVQGIVVMSLMRKLAIVIVVLATTSVAQADPILLFGSFAGSNPSPSSEVTAFSGSWAGVYDDALVPATGYFNMDLTLVFLALSPSPLGATIFNTGNTLAEINFLDSLISNIFIGGPPEVTTLSSSADDFWAIYNPKFGRYSMSWTIASESCCTSTAQQTSGSFFSVAIPVPVPVPEPSTLALLGIGLFGMGLARRKKKA
jgi:hypothetical protein